MSQDHKENGDPYQPQFQSSYNLYPNLDPGFAPQVPGYPSANYSPYMYQWQQQQQQQSQQQPYHGEPPIVRPGYPDSLGGYSSEPVVAAMAMQYGQTLAGQGKQIVNEKLERYITVSRLKYYFAVNTTYVAKKIALLFFPFAHKDWSIRNNEEGPLAPRLDVNAPDLYIPSMAFVTYILIAGYLLGLQNRFSPEFLGKQASSALGLVGLEILVVVLVHYVLSIAASSLKFLDIVAICSYKFVCIIAALLSSLIMDVAYLAVLAYSSCSLIFFLIKTLQVSVLKKPHEDERYGAPGESGQKRSIYLICIICLLQPLMMYWLTYHLAS